MALDAVKTWVETSGASVAFTPISPNSDSLESLSFEVVTPNYEGIRVRYRGQYSGWFLLRKSLHDPILPLNIESDRAGGCLVIRALLGSVLSQVPGVDTSKL